MLMNGCYKIEKNKKRIDINDDSNLSSKLQINKIQIERKIYYETKI